MTADPMSVSVETRLRVVVSLVVSVMLVLGVWMGVRLTHDAFVLRGMLVGVGDTDVLDMVDGRLEQDANLRIVEGRGNPLASRRRVRDVAKSRSWCEACKRSSPASHRPQHRVRASVCPERRDRRGDDPLAEWIDAGACVQHGARHEAVAKRIPEPPPMLALTVNGGTCELVASGRPEKGRATSSGGSSGTISIQMPPTRGAEARMAGRPEHARPRRRARPRGEASSCDHRTLGRSEPDAGRKQVCRQHQGQHT